LRLALVCAVLCSLAASCERSAAPMLDRGKDLVNASGLSKDEVLRLLRNGANVNQRSSSTFGWTPLISAIYHHKPDVIDVLLAAGADVNLDDASCQTPILWTIQVWGSETNLIRYLLDQGADPTRTNRYGSDAFDLARSQSNSAEI